MDLIEEIGIGEERAATRLGAQINGAAAMLDAGKIRRVCIVEFPPAQGDKTWEILLLHRRFCAQDGDAGAGELILPAPLRR